MRIKLLGTWNGNPKGREKDVPDAVAQKLIMVGLAEEISQPVQARPTAEVRETAAIAPPETRTKPESLRTFKRKSKKE